LSNARLVLSHSHFKVREQNAIGIVRATLEALRRKAQVMQKLVWKQRSHSLDAPEGPLVDHLAQFESLLVKQGYPSETIRRFLLLVADFSRWLKAQPLTVKHVTHATAERYLRYRLHHRRRRKGNAPALRKFVQMLQHHGVVELEAHVSQTVVERLISDYSSYLHQERGLAATTVRKYVRAARSFVIHQRITSVRGLFGLSAQQVIRFVQSEGPGGCSAPRAQHMAIGLRSFLRYARYRGFFKPDLAAAIPRVAGWSMTSIPKAISPKDAQRVLASCDRSAVGRRDYAMLLLLARLGLRAGEIASLTLDDIDWHVGTLTVHGKGSQESPLPLLEPIGKAIAAYLKCGRPHCNSRRVFLRMHAPIRGFKTEKPVTTAVGRAMQRAGIDSPHRGAHQFRHALATHMLRRGSSLAEIGEVLRHKDPDTTRIYAKVDLTSLRVLATPWPRT
jgi:site-specific recombinase XerD